MFPAICCLILMYVAAVAQVMAGDGAPVYFPALVVAVAARWFSPGAAAAWAFFMGLIADFLGAGPLGLHAATLVALCGLLPRIGFGGGPSSAGRWMWAVFLIAWWNNVIGCAVALAPLQRWDELERQLIQTSLAAAVTALLAGGAVFGWRQLTGTPCTTH